MSLVVELCIRPERNLAVPSLRYGVGSASRNHGAADERRRCDDVLFRARVHLSVELERGKGMDEVRIERRSLKEVLRCASSAVPRVRKPVVRPPSKAHIVLLIFLSAQVGDSGDGLVAVSGVSLAAPSAKSGSA